MLSEVEASAVAVLSPPLLSVPVGAGTAEGPPAGIPDGMPVGMPDGGVPLCPAGDPWPWGLPLGVPNMEAKLFT